MASHYHYLISMSPSPKTAKAPSNSTRKQQRNHYSFTTNQRYRKSQRSTSFTMSETIFMTKMAAKWLKSIPNLWPKRLKNDTLWGRTYLYSPYKGVPPPPPLGPVTTVILEDRFCFRVSRVHSSPFQPTLAPKAAHRVMGVNFAQFCPFFDPHNRFNRSGVLGKNGAFEICFRGFDFFGRAIDENVS